MRKQYHHGDLGRALVESGLNVLKQEGLEALTLRRAAREANVSASAPYRHFADKQALLAAIAEEGFRELMDMLLETQKSFPEDLNRVAQTYIQFAMKEPETYRLMFTKNLNGETVSRAEPQNEDLDALKVLNETIERGIQNGQIETGSAGDLAIAVWSMIHGFALLIIDGVLPKESSTELNLLKVLGLTKNQFQNSWDLGPQVNSKVS